MRAKHTILEWAAIVLLTAACETETMLEADPEPFTGVESVAVTCSEQSHCDRSRGGIRIRLKDTVFFIGVASDRAGRRLYGMCSWSWASGNESVVGLGMPFIDTPDWRQGNGRMEGTATITVECSTWGKDGKQVLVEGSAPVTVYPAGLN